MKRKSSGILNEGAEGGYVLKFGLHGFTNITTEASRQEVRFDDVNLLKTLADARLPFTFPPIMRSAKNKTKKKEKKRKRARLSAGQQKRNVWAHRGNNCRVVPDLCTCMHFSLPRKVCATGRSFGPLWF